jgi:hypothetical protein
MRCLIGLTMLLAAVFVQAQGIKVPDASRTVFKCNVNGHVTYSDYPCPGAQRLDVEPTRGVSKSTGKERMGADVQREHHREMFAEALKPLTGLDAEELDRRGRRVKLAPGVASECAALDRKIAAGELVERKATPDALPAA